MLSRQKTVLTLEEPLTVCAGARAVPGVDLQCGLEQLSTFFLGLGQLLHSQEMPSSPHLQHSHHGRVGVQAESHLQARVKMKNPVAKG